ncbi:MAG: VOC family protein [Chitinophagales bacterium]|nr:VOC family protein [Chitinophagales bacterium]
MSNKKVTGIGGVFIKANNPKELCAWYDKHLGTTFGKNAYMVFNWSANKNDTPAGSTTFSFFKEDSNYFAPSTKQAMLNFRVENLETTLEELRKAGVQVFDNVEEYDYGKFGWIMDAEGNKIELWEPKNEHLFNEDES